MSDGIMSCMSGGKPVYEMMRRKDKTVSTSIRKMREQRGKKKSK